MMNLEQVLKVNTSLSSAELDELKLLTLKYPWFSLAHQLVLMGCKQNNDSLFAEKCSQTAIYTLNRKRLHNFIEKSVKLVQSQVANNTSYTQEIDKADKTSAEEQIKDDLLLNFSHEYFSIEDLAPIEAAEEESNDNLIAKFINENPRIIPQSSSISDLGNLIQIDESFEEEIVSETLAEIYVSQGLTEQAILCYEKLSLLNPEKSIYFASLIDNLRSSKK